MKVFQLFLWMLLTMVLILGIWSIGPVIETRYFPVYSKFTITKMEEVDEGMNFTARFTKYRNCDPQGFAWYIGDLGTGARVVPARGVVPSTGAVHRPVGTHLVGPVLLKDITMSDVPYLYAEIYHHCHPLWVTRSVIYP